MESSIDTIRRLAGLTGDYIIGVNDQKVTTIDKIDTTNKNIIRCRSKGLTLDELNSYDVFPITEINRDKITYVHPNVLEYKEKKYTLPDRTKRMTISRDKINHPTGNDIVFICRNSHERFSYPVNNFWCNSMDSNYISYETDGFSVDVIYLLYYGRKKGSKGGRPLRPATFRQRRPKRTTSKSRRRATRRRRV
jgi:hypothetical protein